MENLTENFGFIAKGGVLMYPLVLLSLYTATVVIMKIIQFRRLKPLKTDYIDGAVNLIKSGNVDRAAELIRLQRGPVARVAEATITLTRDDTLSRILKESEIERIGAKEVRELETHLRGLEMTSNIAPLMGLLGTVIGMVRAFAKIAENSARVDPSMLAGGIWEALITTVAGLVVAIPALAAYYIIDGHIEKIRNAMKDAAVRLLVLEGSIRQRPHANEAAPVIPAAAIQAAEFQNVQTVVYDSGEVAENTEFDGQGQVHEEDDDPEGDDIAAHTEKEPA